MRSKHRRRMRSVKREKFDKKQLVKLKATLARDLLANKDADMADICTVKAASDLKADQDKIASDAVTDKMDVEATSSQVYDKKTKLSESGQYPPWMNQRAIRKQKQKNKKLKKKGNKAEAW